MKVVDASAVLGWLLAPDPPDRYRRLMHEHICGSDPLVAPELIHYEVANVLVTGAALDREAAEEGYRNFADLEIETFSLGDEEYVAALALAAATGLTVYDASYVVLALRMHTDLVTADRRLAERLPAEQRARVVVL